MKYKLLKDLPVRKAGSIIETDEDWLCWSYIPEAHPDFFEPIVEKNKFEDLKYWDKVWWIFQNWMIIECEFEWECKHETFLTEHDAEMERLRREARANVWLPNKWQDFWNWNFTMRMPYKWVYQKLDNNDYFIWNVHKTKEDAEEYGRKYAKAFEIPNE